MLTACVEDVKRTLDEIKPYFLKPAKIDLFVDPEDFKNKKWNLLEKKFHLLQIEVEKQQLVEELDILSKERPRKISPKPGSGLKFGLKKSKGWVSEEEPKGWGPSSPEKNTPPSPQENNEPKKSTN